MEVRFEEPVVGIVEAEGLSTGLVRFALSDDGGERMEYVVPRVTAAEIVAKLAAAIADAEA
jgi:hypothetical protein